MKKKVLAAILIAVGVLTGCGNSEPISSPIQTVEAEPIATDTKEVEQPATTESSADEVAPEHSYRSELTNEWIDEDLKDQRPIAVMVDNERTALPHFGTADADVVYEIMNSTLNDRITRFMVVVKDWEKIEQLGSIRSARPTNFMLAAEWNAVLCHDGGPYFINDWVAKDYSANFSGGFARFNNGKATEFTEYITYDTYTNSQKGKTYDGLKQRFANSKYTTTYNDYYQGPHFKFADGEVTFDDRSDAISATTIELPFKHNGSTLKYNEETGTYDYYEYGSAHKDADSNAQLTFENVILQDTTFAELGEGYLIYNAIDSGRSGYYITQAMQQSAVNICPYTYSRTNGDIERILTLLGCAEAYLAKHCSIDICIKTYRDFQCFPERSRKIIKSPCQLRSASNIAVGCRFFIQIHRAETADPQCLDSFILKICYHFRHRTLRCLRREYCPVENISLLISYGTYHLCAAGFNSA